MTNSEVGICNLALSLLNVNPITSIEVPDTANEELCALWYDQTRQEALRRQPWNFAVKRVVLAASSEQPAFGDGTFFNLPSDFIRMKWINESNLRLNDAVPHGRYSIEGGKILLSNRLSGDTAELRLVYISDFKTVSRMDAAFIGYFTHLLAQNLAYPVTQSNTTVERTNSLMERAETIARAIDGQDNPPKIIERSRAIAARNSRGRVINLDGRILFD